MSKLTEHIILNDLKKRGITNYTIKEYNLIRPDFIKVGKRELIYLHLFEARTKEKGFDVLLYSDEDKILYTQENTVKTLEVYTSNILTVFESDIRSIIKAKPETYFIQFYKVTY